MLGWSLYTRLSLSFLAILVAVVLGDAGIWIYFWYRLEDIGRQFINWDLAEYVEREIHPLLVPPVDSQQLSSQLNHLSRLNRDIDISIIDDTGRILYRGLPADRWVIDMKPVRDHLSRTEQALTPIFGDNPDRPARAWDARTVFSVAPIKPGGIPGYVYVLLASGRSDTIRNTLGDYYLLFVPLSLFLLIFFFCGVLGLSLFRVFTRRILRLTSTVQLFAEGDLTTRAAAGSDDEIDFLAVNFNAMADTIQRNVHELEQNDRARRSFMTYVSHDLRGPLTSIRGFLQRLRSETRPEKQQDYLAIIERNAASLERMIQSLFELAKLEERGLALKRETFPIVELADETLSRFRVAADAKGITLSMEAADEPLGLYVDGDPALIGRVLFNLVDNALRFTPEGGRVTIGIRPAADDLQISVSDTGAGIPAEDLPKIFDRFYQAENQGPRSDGGSGIGLAIVKHIIEAHGSTITVTSAPGRGTAFNFSLRRAAGAAPEDPAGTR